MFISDIVISGGNACTFVCDSPNYYAPSGIQSIQKTCEVPGTISPPAGYTGVWSDPTDIPACVAGMNHCDNLGRYRVVWCRHAVSACKRVWWLKFQKYCSAPFWYASFLNVSLFSTGVLRLEPYFDDFARDFSDNYFSIQTMPETQSKYNPKLFLGIGS